jgi:hypothetical protein
MANAWLTVFSFAPVVPAVSGDSASDTFRGGKTILVHGDMVLSDPSLDSNFRSVYAPSGWSVTPAGNHPITKYTSEGLHFDSGVRFGQVALARTATYANLEASLLFRVNAPSRAIGDPIPVATFRFDAGGSDSVQIRLQRLPQLQDGLMAVDATVTTVDAGVQAFLGPVVTGTEFALRLTRFENFVFAQINDTLVAASTQFTPFAEGQFSAAFANADTGQRTDILLTDFHVRSHVIVNGRLLEQKRDISRHRMTGRVPAATLAEVGDVPIIFFGPWGDVNAPVGFEYTLPEGLGMRNSPTVKLTTYADRVVRNRL